jgi:pimeloyl-ACP methyl ester carboxylesterase
VLVGHSGGGAIEHATANARPDRIARVVYVGAGPLGDGEAINDVRVSERASAGADRPGHPYVAELAAMRDIEYVDLPTGHWPQFTKPAGWRRRFWPRSPETEWRSPSHGAP